MDFDIIISHFVEEDIWAIVPCLSLVCQTRKHNGINEDGVAEQLLLRFAELGSYRHEKDIIVPMTGWESCGLKSALEVFIDILEEHGSNTALHHRASDKIWWI